MMRVSPWTRLPALALGGDPIEGEHITPPPHAMAVTECPCCHTESLFVGWDYSPGEQRTHLYPGSPPSVEVWSCTGTGPDAQGDIVCSHCGAVEETVPEWLEQRVWDLLANEADPANDPRVP